MAGLLTEPVELHDDVSTPRGTTHHVKPVLQLLERIPVDTFFHKKSHDHDVSRDGNS